MTDFNSADTVDSTLHARFRIAAPARDAQTYSRKPGGGGSPQ
jgi:hypothetical protein